MARFVDAGGMYPSNLTDAQWAVLEPMLMTALAEERNGRHGGGRPRNYPVRRVLEAILYVARTGCQWRALPVNFPPGLSCHQQFRVWRDSGLRQRINGEMVRQSRLRQGRDRTQRQLSSIRKASKRR